jgi:hypothetical protein
MFSMQTRIPHFLMIINKSLPMGTVPGSAGV